MFRNVLPSTFLLYLLTTTPLVSAQERISFDSILSLTSQNLPSNSNTTIAIPTSSNLTISLSICSFSAKFFVTNTTDSRIVEIPVREGMAAFSGSFNDGGTLTIESVNGGGSGTVQVGVSEKGPLQEHLVNFPLLGDTTSNQALLFSPPFALQRQEEPSYPNYTLPVSIPVTQPSSTPNFTLVVSLGSQRDQVGCVLQNFTSAATASQGNVANRTNWLKDAREGWREQWLIEGLSSQTNYSAFVVQDGKKISGPAYFLTKSSSFSCPLVASLPFCPGVSYAVPLAPPTAPSTMYDGSNIPKTIVDGITQYMTNFTTSLTTFACGRDFYSPLQTCSDCQREYRRWLCTIALPRCGEASSTSTPASASAPASQGQSRRLFARLLSTRDDSQPQQPLSALAPQPSTASSRSPLLPPFNTSYNLLLPCIETCQSTDRACPVSLGFKCPPTNRFQKMANQSYGVGIVDGIEDDQEKLGTAGASSDIWGNVWCNGG
ncbi:stretch-activated cation channel mid1 [Marasmius crinis-equi]|uniref:Stretch-activated cation channel mid1 n=1 Tax=Marasmius crinis-equi TaxID=585013 RepID=A0ABR3FPM5_9AGAR